MPQSQSSLAVGIDIGGTTSRAALVDSHNVIVRSARCPTPDQLERLIAWITEAHREWSKSNQQSMPIGLALPGVVDPAKGTLIRSINLPWLEGEPIADLLKVEIESRPVLMTDAQAATWGEYVGAGSPAALFAHLRLGTGVACAVVVDGVLIPTDPARRTHWPLLVVDSAPDAPLCSCGLRGCLEVFAGGDSLSRSARDLGFRNLSDLNRGLESGYKNVVELIERAAAAVVTAVSKLHTDYGVTTVVLGGGVITAIPLLMTQIIAFVESSQLRAVRVHPSILGDDAGVIGAAQLAIRTNSNA